MQLKKPAFKFLAPQSAHLAMWTGQRDGVSPSVLHEPEEWRNSGEIEAVPPELTRTARRLHSMGEKTLKLGSDVERWAVDKQEREMSEALFVEEGHTEAEVVEALRVKFDAVMLSTVCKFDEQGLFGNLYNLLDDKDNNLVKCSRPIQPNRDVPRCARLQNLQGRALDVISNVGGSFTLGDTHILSRWVEEIDKEVAGACCIMGVTMGAKNQFSNPTLTTALGCGR
ncbi:hypothetical protein CYMTET_53212 [Cymbomonas tetramitiformis]|uniref:Uncharacterized protein n=1 Tax=Cymbomonas tetramitiformis TaxID=36881 RepID=A0AAE0BIS0_9CHLO|nr:hypothetical protein CYMTET_53212 [Cymbomonas tetramitiformis]